MRNKCLFIVPYFGNFPKTFSYWLKCCRNNPDFYWYIISDNPKDGFDIPNNVLWETTTLSLISQKISDRINCDIRINKPYKLCDFKPFYGFFFSDIIKDYNYWGYCDLDLFFGNLASFLNDEVLSLYEKVNCLGHMSLLKNIDEVNYAFEDCNWKTILSDKRIRVFDEVRFEPNINSLIKNRGLSVKPTIAYADIGSSHFCFQRTEYTGNKRCEVVDKRPMIFSIENGRAFQYSIDLSNKIEKKELAYFHFQKRKIEVEELGLDEWILVPNKVIGKCEITEKMIRYYSIDSKQYYFYNRMKWIKRALSSRI